MFLGRDNEAQQYLVPTWLPKGMRLVILGDEITVDPFTATEKNYEYRTESASDTNQRLRLTLRMPSFPRTELFGEWVDINGEKAVLNNDPSGSHLTWMIGDCSITLDGGGLTASELTNVARSVHIVFDEFGPHLGEFDALGLVELTQRRESRPVLHYFDESGGSQFSLFTYESIPTGTEPNCVLSVAGVEVQAHFSLDNTFVWSDANPHSADIWEASLSNGDEATLRNILENLQPVTRSEFAMLERTIGTGVDTTTQEGDGFQLAGSLQLRDGSLVRYSYKPSEDTQDAQEIELSINCRGHCFVIALTPSPNPAFRGALRLLDTHQAIAVATAPITGSTAQWPDGTNRSADALPLDDNTVLLVVTRYDDELPFVSATFTKATNDPL
jgi:hypothetical protein